MSIPISPRFLPHSTPPSRGRVCACQAWRPVPLLTRVRLQVCLCGFNPCAKGSELGGSWGACSASPHRPPQAVEGNAGKGRPEPASRGSPRTPNLESCARGHLCHICVCARPAPCPMSRLVCSSEKDFEPLVPRLKSEHLQNRKPGSSFQPSTPAASRPPPQSSLCSSCRQPPAPDFEISETKLVL